MKYFVRKKILAIAFFSVILTSCGGCGGGEITLSTVKDLIDIGTSIVGLIQQFNKGNDEVKNNIVEVAETTTQRISAEEQPSTIIEYWIDKWDTIGTQYSHLQSLLTDINNSSQDYFTKLENNNKLISSNNGEKEEDLKRTEDLKANWNAEFDTVSNQLENIGQMITKVNDSKILLTNEAGRDAIRASFDKLKDLSSQADELVKEINDFSSNAQAIFSSENIDHENSTTTSNTVDTSNNSTNSSMESCQFNNVDVEYDNDAKGLKIHVKCDMENLQDVDCAMEALLFLDNGDVLKSNDGASVDQVTAMRKIKPCCQSTSFNNNDIVIFVRDSDLPQSAGTYSLKALVVLYDNNSTKVAESDYIPFTYTVGSQ